MCSFFVSIPPLVKMVIFKETNYGNATKSILKIYEYTSYLYKSTIFMHVLLF
jgi:hypothetical protein